MAAGAVALAGMGIAKLKKLDHSFHLDFPCCIHVYINIVRVMAF